MVFDTTFGCESPRSRYAWALGVALVLARQGPVWAQEGGDLQAQISYAYQTEDVKRLEDLRETLADSVKSAHAGVALRYHLAHADYRYALLTGKVRADQSEQALDECVNQLDLALQQNKDSAEVLVLQSACYSNLAQYRKLRAAWLRTNSEGQLANARRSAPRNPRVLLITAMNRLDRGKLQDPIPPELAQAAAAFDRASATMEDMPGWGAAECYLRMGHELRIRADALGARNWIERALIVAPQYRSAQHELAQLER